MRKKKKYNKKYTMFASWWKLYHQFVTKQKNSNNYASSNIVFIFVLLIYLFLKN